MRKRTAGRGSSTCSASEARLTLRPSEAPRRTRCRSRTEDALSEKQPTEPQAPPAFTARSAIAIGAVLVLALLAWQLSDVLLLAFAAVLLGLIFRGLGTFIERHTPLKHSLALAASVIFIAGVAIGFIYLLGAEIRGQISTLADQLPQLVSSLGDRLGIENLPARLSEGIENISGRAGLVGRIAGYTSWLVSALANIALLAVAGVYLAADARRYRKGLLLLVPAPVRGRAAAAVYSVVGALRLWIMGQLASMVVVGVLTTAGLYVLGIESALALGFLAGVFEFVPFVGPVLSAVPAILVGLSESGTTALWVVGLYVLIQQIENNLIVPLVQRRMVHLPPVVTLFSILSLGILFGPAGVLLGTPLTVVLYVLVKQLYVRDTLGETVSVPGENH